MRDDNTMPAAEDGFRLRSRDRAFFRALAEAAMPPSGKLPGAGSRAVERFELFLDSQAEWVRWLFLALGRSLDLMTRLRSLRGFAALPRERREQLLCEWSQGRTHERLMCRLLTTPLKVAHFDDPAIHVLFGSRYAPEPVVESSPPRYMQQVRHLPDLDRDLEIEAEVVVVGTGAGGAVVARELAARGIAVVMLEEGQYLRRPDLALPHAEKLARLYRSGGMLATFGNAPVALQLGCCVGGTTAINSGTCYRPGPEVLRDWRRMGLGMFTPEHLEPYFERVEAVLQVQAAAEKNLGRIAAIIRRGCDALGYAHEPVPRNAPDCDAQAHCQFGCPSDAKRSTNVSYVPLALDASALLYTGATVTRVLTRKGRAAGVRARAALPGGGARHLTVEAPLVVVSCGALLTPPLLMRSGLCTRGGQLGRNLSIHPSSAVFAVMDEEVRGWEGIPQSYAVTEFIGQGITMEGGFPRLEFATLLLPAQGRAFMDLMARFERVAVFGFMLRDDARGRVFRGPGSLPIIRYDFSPVDRYRIKRARELLCRIFLAAGARQVYSGIPGAPPIEGQPDLDRFIRTDVPIERMEFAAFHPLGTARLGTSAKNSVTAHDHQAHELPGLYIVDGSSVPTPLGVNPQVTIMALATRAAELIAEQVR
ncbi:MAG: GMC family oxidoreductase [Deltaproteobacteria bacterium]|nr:GMC family oxidoreductase [Deltaproteobacteria bacterium]